MSKFVLPATPRQQKPTANHPRGQDEAARGQHLAQVPARDASANPQPLQRRSPGGARLRRRADYHRGRSRPRRRVTSMTPAGTCSPLHGVAGARDEGHPTPCSRKTSPAPRPARGRPDRRAARPQHPTRGLPSARPAARARAALTGLGRVAVHGIGRDVHLLHARVLPAREGPHGRCDLGVARRRSPRLSAPAGRTPDAGVGGPPRPARRRRCG